MSHAVLDGLLGIHDPVEFADAIHHTLRERAELTERQQAFLDVLELGTRIAMAGFCDVFYQMLTASRARLVHELLHELGLPTLGELFWDAFRIYTRDNIDISDASFAELEPFSLPPAEGNRFDAIADLIVAPESELYSIPRMVFSIVRTAHGAL